MERTIRCVGILIAGCILMSGFAIVSALEEGSYVPQIMLNIAFYGSLLMIIVSLIALFYDPHYTK